MSLITMESEERLVFKADVPARKRDFDGRGERAASGTEVATTGAAGLRISALTLLIKGRCILSPLPGG